VAVLTAATTNYLSTSPSPSAFQRQKASGACCGPAEVSLGGLLATVLANVGVLRAFYRPRFRPDRPGPTSRIPGGLCLELCGLLALRWNTPETNERNRASIITLAKFGWMGIGGSTMQAIAPLRLLLRAGFLRLSEVAPSASLCCLL